jgi:hypothetical protein
MAWRKGGNKKGIINCEQCSKLWLNKMPCLDLKTDEEKKQFVCHYYHKVTILKANETAFFIWKLLDIHERPLVQGVTISLPVRLGCLATLGQIYGASLVDLDKVLIFEHNHLL